NYTAEWRAEAERRGLLNRRTTPEALADWASEANIALYERYGVFTRNEAESRFHVQNEIYANKIKVEATAAVDMAETIVLPAAYQYQSRMAESIDRVRGLLGKEAGAGQLTELTNLCQRIEQVQQAIEQVRATKRAIAQRGLHEAELAKAYCTDLVPSMARLREAVDSLELWVDDDLWPLPKYREMLFIH
ncbi:MAG TPA: glutamine synthetase type III, partial [Planctomycetota bacterium]|nr:glutamine synthetase type III [Planctomycetota bacterium]